MKEANWIHIRKKNSKINIHPEIMEVVGFVEECVHGVSAIITKHPATGGRRGLSCHSLRTHINQGEM